MATATPIASGDAGLPPNSYIYKIISTAPRQDPLTYSKLDQLAIISSDDSLRFLDPSNLSATGVIKNVNDKVTCLERANDTPSNVVATAGRDGKIRFWDKRTRQKALEIESRVFIPTRKPVKRQVANTTPSPQAHLGPSLRRLEELHRCRHRKPRRRTRRISRLRLVTPPITTSINTPRPKLTPAQGPTLPHHPHPLPHRIPYRHNHLSSTAPLTPHASPLLQHRWPCQHLRHVAGRGGRRAVPSD